MNQTTPSPITKIQERYPDAAFVTTGMIAQITGINERAVRYYCRKYMRLRCGHYRFWLEDEPGKPYLTRPDLERLLRIIAQAKKRGF